MTPEQFNSWKEDCHANRHDWRRDLSRELRDPTIYVFAYKGRWAGQWVRIFRDGHVDLGTFSNGYPNIADAILTTRGSHKCLDGEDALQRLIAAGVKGLESVTIIPSYPETE